MKISTSFFTEGAQHVDTPCRIEAAPRASRENPKELDRMEEAYRYGG